MMDMEGRGLGRVTSKKAETGKSAIRRKVLLNGDP